MADAWNIQWYECRADSKDVEFAKSEGRKLKVGAVLWRAPLSIGPVAPDHNHWSGWNLGCTEQEAKLVAQAPVLLDIAREFVRRVDAGEVRSRRTYAAMKAVIAAVDGANAPE